MENEWLYDVSQWVTYPLSFVAILAAAEIGRRLGVRRRQQHAAADGKTQITTFEAALLGLLSLMIGFSFSLALTRYDARRAVVLEEANAIGTAALRATMLPAPHDAELAKLFRDYVDVRIALAAGGNDREKRDAAIAASQSIHDQLWKHAAAVLVADPRSLPGSLFVEALNAVIDVHAKRLTARANHVPEVAFLMLYAVAMVSLGFSGYSGGLAGSRNMIPTAIMALAIATVITLIVDFDRPYRGMVTVSQQPMIDLRTGLAGGPK